jgi:TonB family protein
MAAVLVLLVFLTSDVVPYEEIKKHFGWEGELQLLPEITIIPDKQLIEEIQEDGMPHTSTSLEVSYLDETGPSEGGTYNETPPTDENREEMPEITEAELRQYPAHTDVPYTKDYVILHLVKPVYPPKERLEGIEGDVTVELLVNDEGWVENAWIVLGVGPQSFEASSLDAVRQFRFKPPMEDGRPVPMWIRFLIRFRLYS